MYPRLRAVAPALALAGVAGLLVGAVVTVWPTTPEPAPGGVLAVLQAPTGQLLTHGDDTLPPRPPGPPQATRVVGWPCEGDGTDGPRVQWVYGYSGTDNLGALRPTLEQIAGQVEGIFADSSANQRLVRYVTEPDCSLSILPFRFGESASFDATINELVQAGHDRTDRKYLVVTEFSSYCGIGTVTDDDQAGPANAANGGPSYSRVDSGCRNAFTAAHELVHNLGGVQLSSPHNTGGWHCNDALDVMCYADGSASQTQRTVCPSPVDRERLDCGRDDYFSLNASGYLSTHWNVASSAYLGSPADTTVPPSTIPPTTVPPTTSTTTGKGRTTTDLILPDRMAVGTDVLAVARVSGCSPSGSVAFYVSGKLLSRQVLEPGSTVQSVLLRFTKPGRFTVRATFSGDSRCATSTDSDRRRVAA